MTLASCRECGQRISTEATSCPNCGALDPTAAQVEPAKQETRKAWSGFLLLLILALVLIYVIGSTGEPSGGFTDSRDAPEVITLEATVGFANGQIVIAFAGPANCRDAKIYAYRGSGREGYGYTAPLLEAGEKYTLGSTQFARSDGERFNPATMNPRGLTIHCTINNRFDGFYHVEW